MSSPPVKGPKDGEYDRSFDIFGNYVQTREFITVRLHLMPDPVLHARPTTSDLTKPGPIIPLAQFKRLWKQTIRAVWNDPGVPTPTGMTKPLNFDVEWVPYNQHASVLVADWSTSKYESVRDTLNRAMMFRWVSDMDAKRPVSAHEFGHYLGLIDTYMYDGEILHFTEEIKASASKSSLSVPFWSFETWAANVRWIEARANERRKNGRFADTETDLMESSSYRTISPELINAIAERREQILKWHPRQWIRNHDVELT